MKTNIVDGVEYRYSNGCIGNLERWESGINCVKIQMHHTNWYLDNEYAACDVFTQILRDMFPDLSVKWNAHQVYLVGAGDEECGHLICNIPKKACAFFYPFLETSNKVLEAFMKNL